MTTRRTPPRAPLAALLLAALASGCGRGPDADRTVPSADPQPAESGGWQDVFTDEAAASGLDFKHFNGMSGELYYSEMMGSGAAFLDYDGDGDLDVYLVQGEMLPAGKPLAEATFPPTPDMLPLRDRLYRNDLGSDRRPRFTDVTAESGLSAATGYGMGVAAGDFDNDGNVDLYVTRAGSNQLWRNRGGSPATFEDVTAATGSDDPRWSLSATWVDVDRDGWLDLYVVNYVDFSLANHQECRMLSGIRDYCGPQVYGPLGDRLLRNRGGDGGRVTFEEIPLGTPAPGMGVVAGDFDQDGWPDLYVANDGAANQLWRRQADGSFQDEALLRGLAFNAEGLPEAGMGVVAGDYDRDGDEDVLATHLALETHTLYRNDSGFFDDVTVRSGLGAPSWPMTGFGAAWIDVDNDGWPDLMTVNGAVILIPEQVAAGEPHPLAMSGQLFRNLGTGADGAVTFEDATAAAGEALQTPAVRRGLTLGDVDNDGDSDALLTRNAGPAELLVNRIGQDRHWLGLRLVTPAGRDALGAAVEVLRSGGDGPRLWRRVATGGGYLSSHDPRVLFGLGDDPEVGAVRVRWPDASIEDFAVEADRYSTLTQGTGRQVGDAR